MISARLGWYMTANGPVFAVCSTWRTADNDLYTPALSLPIGTKQACHPSVATLAILNVDLVKQRHGRAS